MVQFDYLDIIAGLEEAYFKIVQFASNTTQTKLNSRIVPASRPRKVQLAIRSLIVLWAPLYDGFDGARKTSWTDYWGSLPFGDHSGLHGWPGSGFSAFIYVNAPRYKDGLDLLLDPPTTFSYKFFVSAPNFLDLQEGATSGLQHYTHDFFIPSDYSFDTFFQISTQHTLHFFTNIQVRKLTPLPESNVILNGDFSDGVNHWDFNDNLYTLVTGGIVIPDSDGNNGQMFQDPVPMDLGASYRIDFDWQPLS